MLEILDSPKHLVAMKLSGDLTAEDVSKAYKATEDALKENDRISFFAEIETSVHLTVEGLFKDLVEGIGQIGKLKHYYRAAVVTDKSWLAALVRVEGLVFSSKRRSRCQNLSLPLPRYICSKQATMQCLHTR
jgi:hypothetical protein